MGEDVRITTAVVKVLAVFLDDPAHHRYGLDLILDKGLPSGTLYSILTFSERAGWVRADGEVLDAVAEGRAARRYYRLTFAGALAARTELAGLDRRLSKADGSGVTRRTCSA
jgi:DNA-binding PadR family transcriptional regulator